MPTSKRQSLLAPPLWPFKNLEIQREADGSLSFSQRGIEHICQLNSIPNDRKTAVRVRSLGVPGCQNVSASLNPRLLLIPADI